MKLVSIDLGTSSVKTALIDERLNILSTSRKDYQIRTVNVDWVELDADVVLKAVVEAIKCLPGSRDADMVVFDNFSPTPMLMNAEGDALYPIITHLDRRSKKQTRDILENFGHDRFQAITGIQPFTGGASITSILWLKENEPEKAAKLADMRKQIKGPISRARPLLPFPRYIRCAAKREERVRSFPLFDPASQNATPNNSRKQLLPESKCYDRVPQFGIDI
jgi:glycerol kinase